MARHTNGDRGIVLDSYDRGSIIRSVAVLTSGDHFVCLN